MPKYYPKKIVENAHGVIREVFENPLDRLRFQYEGTDIEEQIAKAEELSKKISNIEPYSDMGAAEPLFDLRPYQKRVG